VDVLVVSLGSTRGLRAADAELAESLRRTGAEVVVAAAVPPRGGIRTFALTDLAWARAARQAAVAQLARHRPRAVIYSSTTAALLWPRQGAVRFDATSAGNRPGRHGLWQRPLERRRLGQAPLLLPWSEGGLREAPDSARRGDRVLVLPVPVEPSGSLAQDTMPGWRGRDITAITYAANPSKKGLDRVLTAWRRLLADRRSADLRSAGPRSPASEELLIAGASEEELGRAGFVLAAEDGVRVAGWLCADDYRALVRRARVFVCAPRREDYGIAQLEALADGCLLVTTPAPGPYAALAIARELDPRLVGDDLGAGLRAALDDPLPGYTSRAREALAPFRRDAIDRLVAEDLLPRLLA
jgi:glycosyltransferase involved in cell wall biosynthesis